MFSGIGEVFRFRVIEVKVFIRIEWDHKVQLDTKADFIQSKVEDATHHGFNDLPHLSHHYSIEPIQTLRHSTIVTYQKYAC